MVIKPQLRALVLVTIAAFGCRAPKSNTSGLSALAHNRYLLGAPVPWVAATINASEVDRSMSRRREVAWGTVAQALRPVAILNPNTHEPLIDTKTGEPMTLPAWQTWYELSEFKAMFAELYWHGLTAEQRQKAVVDDSQVDQVLTNFPQRPLAERWQQSPTGDDVTRFARLLEQLTDPNDLRSANGVSGQGYTLFSPQLIRHYLRHYGSVSRCVGTPADYETHTSADFATCFGEAFPPGAAALKATWAQVDNPVATFDTSAAGLARLMAEQQGSWTPTATVHPGAADIYTASTFVDSRRTGAFQLLGLHLITKDIPNWLWTTLWWSPQANADFGEDRPAEIAQRDHGVWANYKMCTVAAFKEGDPVLINTEAKGESLSLGDDPSLRAALNAAYHFGRPYTLCSNPFIEFQRGAGRTNCIGCHQHSGPFTANPKHDPGRDQQRRSFMADFLWSFEDTTEQFRGAIVQVLNDPDS